MTIPKVRRETENGTEVAVLVSCGFGAGWSSWTQDEDEKAVLLFHRDLVNLVLEDNRDQAAILAEVMTECYAGGARDLEVVWVPEGAEFYIHEYDGSETLRLKSNFKWQRA